MNLSRVLKIIVRGNEEEVRINGTVTIKNTIFSHIDAETADFLSKGIGLPYELLIPPGGQFGKLISGTDNFTGMVGMLQIGEADMAVSILTITEERSKAVSYSYPITIADISFLTNRLEYSSYIGSFLWTFSKEVWIGVIFCLLIVPIIFYLLSKKSNSLLKLFMSTFGILLRQDLAHKPQTLNDYLLLGSWMLWSFFITCFYSAVLLSVFSFPPPTGIRTIRELSAGVMRGEYQCTTYIDGYVADVLIHSSDPSVQVIGRNLKENEGSNDFDSVLKNYFGKKTVYIGGNPPDLNDEYFVSKEVFFNSIRATAIRKDFCCKEKLDKVTHYLWASGLYSKLSKDESFLRKLRKRLNSSNTDSSTVRKLDIMDFAGPFLFLVCSYIIAFLVFLAELLAPNILA